MFLGVSVSSLAEPVTSLNRPRIVVGTLRDVTRSMLRTSVALALVTAMSCTPAAPRRTLGQRLDTDEHADLQFEASPGGVPEVDVDWMQARGEKVRIVDVREAHELVDGHVPGAEHVPLSRLPEASADWDPREPIVLVCRSGRRSARGVHTLEGLGFSRVASMTGGMIAWRLAQKPIDRSIITKAAEAQVVAEGPLSASRLEDALVAAPPRQVRAATLLLHGTEACVDGREEHAVVGTPGGDAGELLLALATVEDMTGRELGEGEIVALFDAYVESFGRFYFHSDEHALEALGEALHRDPRFAGVSLPPGAAPLAQFVAHPPAALREALLEHMLTPKHIGCGHLRLLLSNPEGYGVRLGLAQALGRVVFRLLWTQPEAIDFVVLHGDHAEEAVVNVTLPGEVHAYTNVPAIPPRIGGHSVFVNHPQVAAFIRRQHAQFLFEELPALQSSGQGLDAFERALEGKAAQQLGLTIGALAAKLPVFELHYAEGRPTVTLQKPGAVL